MVLRGFGIVLGGFRRFRGSLDWELRAEVCGVPGGGNIEKMAEAGGGGHLQDGAEDEEE